MATKTWNGATAPFSTSLDWSDGIVPGAGDIAIINGGVVSASGILVPALTIDVTSNGASPTLTLNGAAIQAGDRIVIDSKGPDSTLSVSGMVTNSGSITLKGIKPALVLSPTASTTVFDNEGGVSVIGAGSTISSFGSGAFTNNAMYSFRNTGSTVQVDKVFASVGGTGSMRLSGGSTLQISGGVSSSQTIVFETGNNTLQLDALFAFSGTIQGFGAGDDLQGLTSQWTSDSFQATSGGGVLTFKNGNAIEATVALKGNYTNLNDFTIVQTPTNGGFTQTDIKTGVADPQSTVSFTDTVSDVSGADFGTVYAGPVSYLQYQYLWNGPDSVAIGANVNNVFLHGGPGSDALAAKGGSNVIDGGGGSNFLVGAPGTDGGTDTFFVDERGNQVTWSTLLNFHQGDAVTIFGFNPGVSTTPVSIDGTPGYTGATIHSEIGGAGTGVNGSVTFAGVSLADFLSKFSTSTGSVGDTTYLYITRVS